MDTRRPTPRTPQLPLTHLSTSPKRVFKSERLSRYLLIDSTRVVVVVHSFGFLFFVFSFCLLKRQPQRSICPVSISRLTVALPCGLVCLLRISAFLLFRTVSRGFQQSVSLFNIQPSFYLS
ncbi:hypothetical protein B0T20DRAFT_243183 [Sordaria brevicollis]|uniref:Transmembrane protein n=1 Tax=Sordaria brevicollis TaxID=83679 RepID=A0AAE0PB85_SORBR|nr:hypothetical protein B0T20DRAFT_243183 [Sordaria brevicollis]